MHNKYKLYALISSILLVVFLLFLCLSAFYQTEWAISVLEYYNPRALIRFKKCPIKAVALTFDDSPSQATKYLLDILKQNNATATFFLMGLRVDQLTNITKRITRKHQQILRNGNDIGNHMYNEYRAFELSQADFFGEFNKTDFLLNRGYWDNNNNFKWFRPSSFFAKDYMYTIVEKYGYKMVLGSVHSFDMQIQNGRYNMMALMGRIKSGDIVICHDILQSVGYIESLVVYLRSQGYEILSLSKMYDLCEGKK
ncbi:hypothetical protein EIN_095560 [Entamoeba invadens IP1]|uniref:NodB homology domain-containing protein n=2 Tax=Entamoeba invadens TaxID=33085 RepID=A0A0A1U093_ENTIV|nr:hypothetical protein EIN_095560 [Entamoeba invadens IP1]ABB90109.1 chitin deacetylase 2 [Entamoeba invadens]ELP87299.1 hypothetical protein EIN_095560 [Entamoeba invadens IP1]|eukprot:XP_004254070.1 hypothetical protein EIN_095560 [Entamoeba invadens IP1]